MTKYVGILGTHGWPTDLSRAWWHHTSPLAQFLQPHGLEQARPERPFVWSGDLDGVPFAGNDWEAGSQSLIWYLEALPYWHRNLIAHSHGGAVALAAAVEIPIRSLLTVGTPVRQAVQLAGATALTKGHIGAWTHVYDRRWDRVQWLGQLFDGRWFGRRAFQLTGMTDDGIAGIGHSSVLHDPDRFPLWVARGWIDGLVGAGSPQAA